MALQTIFQILSVFECDVIKAELKYLADTHKVLRVHMNAVYI